MRAFVIALLLVIAALPVSADSLVARYGPAYSTGGLYVDVSGVNPVPSISQVSGVGYTVDFFPPPPPNDTTRGVVNTSGPTFARPQTPSGPWAGNYLSTGDKGDRIVITFDTPQTALTFLWGSVDRYNYISFDGGADISGTAVGSLFSNFPYGNQEKPGSVYVRFDRTTPFTTVTFKSDPYYAFEFADVRAVPDGGMTLMLLGGALVGLETLRRRFGG